MPHGIQHGASRGGLAAQGISAGQEPPGLRGEFLGFAEAVHACLGRCSCNGEAVEPVCFIGLREQGIPGYAVRLRKFFLVGPPCLDNTVVYLESGLLRLHQQDAGHGRYPAVGLAAAPVGKAAVGVLPGVEPGDDAGHQGTCLGGIDAVQLRQEVHQGEAAGAELLGAVVRVIAHGGVEPVGIRHRECAHLQLSAGHFAAGAGGQGEALHPGYGGLRLHDGQGNFFAGLVPGSGGGHFHMRHALLRQGLHLEAHQLVSGACEMHPFRAVGQFYGAVGLDGYRNVFHAFLQGEDIHRHGNLFPAAQLARKGANHHERTLHGNGLLGTAEGAVVGRHHHHADAAHVLRQLHLDHIRALGRHRAGCKAQHHRVKAVVLAGAADGIFVTANGREGREPPVPGTHYVVVQVPGSDAQGFHLVHAGPRVRRLEGR